jgi:NifB/MoaA-like Fe-S oxidoreductase
VGEGLSPLYVSIHSTDPELRARLLRNRRGATSLRWLGALLEAGIEVHGQVVVCPGINDGDALDDTLLGVLDRYPELASVGVVPLGVSDHTTELDMRPHTRAEAERVLDVVAAWQARFLAALGRRLVYAADEYFLLAGREFPALDDYDDLPQHENGVGMARRFEHEVRAAIGGDAVSGMGPRTGFFSWVDGAPADGYRAPRSASSGVATSVAIRSDRPVAILTGAYGARVLEGLLPMLRGVGRADVRVVEVPNRFFGGNIGVTGLLTAADVRAALAHEPSGDRYLLPDVVLSGDRFLDGATPRDLPLPVEVIGTDGASLVAALTG